MPWCSHCACWHPHPSRKYFSVARCRVKECFVRLAVIHNRRPRDMNRSGRIDRQRRSVFRAPIQLPVVLAHSYERTKVASAISRLCKGDVAHASWKNMAPRRIHATARINCYRRFATETDVLRNSCFNHAPVRTECAVINFLRRLSFVRRAAVRHRSDLFAGLTSVEPHRVYYLVATNRERFPPARAGK